MLPQEVLRAKRDGAALSAAEIGAFVGGIVDGSVVDAQLAAFAMAVCLRGMTVDETVALTLAMRDSGRVLDWRALGEGRPVVDKHSTGGIGDKVSLILAPLLAACGAAVPMLSGRGLGHTGGTLDKLDAIPGYRSQVALDHFVRVVRDTGCAIVGATRELAPADRRLYAVRDVTGTVESIPLITASILSKKLAGGAQALVMDVKVGSGAFMIFEAEAMALADSLVRIGNGAGLPTVALLTDMDQPLGRSAGNALETHEAIAALCGRGCDGRLRHVTLALAAEALVACGLCADRDEAATMAARRLADGAAAEVFARSVAALGGPADLLDRPAAHLPRAPHVLPVTAEAEGHVGAIDTRALGLAVVELGGGRTRPEDAVDHRVGLTDFVTVGERIERGRPLCLVHAADEAQAARAVRRVRAAIRLDPAPATARPLVRRPRPGASGYGAASS